MFTLIRLLIGIFISAILFFIIRKSTFLQMKLWAKSLPLALFILLFFVLCQVNFENVLGFSSIQNAFKYEKMGSIEQIVSSKNSSMVLYAEKSGDILFDVYYTKENRWYLDKLNVDFKWCDNISVTLCEEKEMGDNYILISFAESGTVVEDSMNSSFAELKYGDFGSTFIFSTLSSPPLPGYVIKIGNNSYELGLDGFFTKR